MFRGDLQNVFPGAMLSPAKGPPRKGGRAANLLCPCDRVLQMNFNESGGNDE